MTHNGLDPDKLANFWKEFGRYMNLHHTKLELRSPKDNLCVVKSPGIADIRITFKVKKDSVISNIYFTEEERARYQCIFEKKDEIDKAFIDSKPVWNSKVKKPYIDIPFPVANVLDEEDYEKYFSWLAVTAEKLIELCSTEVDDLKKYQEYQE